MFSHRSQHVRWGLSLVEILMVIGILGLLVAMLIPAISRSRETARQRACGHNLSQQGSAIRSYISAHPGKLPPLDLNDREVPEERFSWRVAILPFLENQALHDQLDIEDDPWSEKNLAVVQAVLTEFQCPSVPGYPRVIAWTGDTDRITRLGAQDFSAVFLVEGAAVVPRMPGVWFGGHSKDQWSNPAARTTPASLSAIRDGLSKTVCLVEQAGKPEYQGDVSQEVTPQWSAVGGWALADTGIFHRIGGNLDNFVGALSFHHSRFHVEMCDGAVWAITQDIDPAVWGALLTRDGSEIVDPVDWR